MSGAVYGEGIADYIAAVQAGMKNDPPSIEPSRRRARFERYADLFKEPYPEGLQVRDHVHAASGREIPVRIYRPAGDRLLPTLVYMHGGGFVSGSIATHDSIVAQLAALAGIQVVSVHYRRAPENPFPAALEDTYEVLRWLGEDFHGLPVDTNRLLVGGDSAGANLATAAAMLSAIRGGPRPTLQLLLYPGPLDTDIDTPSYLANRHDPFLSRADLEFYIRCYLGNTSGTPDHLAMPMKAAREQLAGLPPALLLVAGLDPLRDDGRRYAAKLEQAGVEVEFREVEGAIHGFLRAAPISSLAYRERAELCGSLRRRLV